MRASGILLHITSLPGPYGIGTMGREAYAFVDRLRQGNQKYWQILPLGPTGFGDSPYQTDSAFAGNPFLIDLEELISDALLEREEVESVNWGDDPSMVDFEAVYRGRGPLFRLACLRGWERDKDALECFQKENPWLEDYALFRALKEHFGQVPWSEWEDEDIRLRRSVEVMERYKFQLAGEMRVVIYTQYLFFRQWNALRAYAKEQGIGIIGDVPIYVPMDSADVWSNRELFQLDGEGKPSAVAGVPPDYFSEDGQLWGNPLYNWERMKKDGYHWWLSRMEAAARLYDTIRIDHFRGLESYWAVPFGEETARNGCWLKGPGEDFVTALKNHLPETGIVAEDLGILTEDVHALRKFSNWPGMKILQFAFDAGGQSTYLPHRYEENCVCYTGTHDNAALPEWAEEANPADISFAREYFGISGGESFCREVIRGGMASVANLFIARMQDWLELGRESRMNTPGTLGGGNWRWRMTEDMLRVDLFWDMARMTYIYGRS